MAMWRAAIAMMILFSCADAPDQARARISIVQTATGAIVSILLSRPMERLRFDAIGDDYRSVHWTMPENFEQTTGGGNDVISRIDGKAFTQLEFSVRADTVRLEKNYQPLAAYGEHGLLLYTGHFWPVDEAEERLPVSFDFYASQDAGTAAQVVAFDQRAPIIKDWQSPHNAPAFVYFGPHALVASAQVAALVDPHTPPWLIDAFETITTAAMETLATTFDRTPAVKPNLFVAAPLGDDPGRLSYSGDALPGQFQITLRGGGWRKPDGTARDIFRRTTIHEAVHLWQWDELRSEAGPGWDWIHEGGADAIAAETMVALGFWSGDEFDRFRNEAYSGCASDLDGGSLITAHQRGTFGAFYSCGVVIADLIARADGGSTGAFWRDFTREQREQTEAGEPGAMNDEDFFQFLAVRVDDQGFADALRLFVETPYANPAREIERLGRRARALAPSDAD